MNFLFQTLVDSNGNVVGSQQINPKPDKDANPSDVSQLITILEAKFIKVADRIIIGILTTKGIFVIDYYFTFLIFN
jgi:hypothetical protein